MSKQADGIIVIRDQTLIPPSCRVMMLEHLHSGHLGRDKMKSLARLLCWWPSINSDIAEYVSECTACARKPRTYNNWKPWPVTIQPMQRVHADYCGPFLGKYYALVLEDAYSKFPEVILTESATVEFTKRALQKYFAREGIAQVLVTDNGTHFPAKDLQDWLKSIGCSPIFTAPRHPQSNGLAENFVRTLKTAINVATVKDFYSLTTSCCSIGTQHMLR